MANYIVHIDIDPVTMEHNISFISSSGPRFSKTVLQTDLTSDKNITLEEIVNKFIEECIERM